MDPGYRALLEKQGYHITGEHSAVKLCHWMRQSLLYGRVCYKQRFYGIRSHRCMQMTPTLDQCTQMCVFCWREQGFTDPDYFGGGARMGAGPGRRTVDMPEEIVERSFEAQRQLVSGFKGDPRCDEAMWEEARNPDQVAISLSGEPTLYPHLSELIRLYKRRGMTVFLVTNGTVPEALEGLDELPTQLYVSVDAPDLRTFKELCRPIGDVRARWDALMRTLELFPSLGTRTVVRHTLLEGANMGDPAGFAKLDRVAESDFIEPKGYVFVGSSRMRLNIGYMPSHESVRSFGERLASDVGYQLADEMPPSRVVLLSRDGKTLKLPGADDD
jgi:tRNA wybutosine-synthesizing protein 1